MLGFKWWQRFAEAVYLILRPHSWTALPLGVCGPTGSKTLRGPDLPVLTSA